MRYCPNCGTEVDESAVFCPTCGQPIDQAVEAQIPAAPAWPEPAPPAEDAMPGQDATPAQGAGRAEPSTDAEPSRAAASEWDAARARIEVTRVVERPAEPEPPPATAPPPPARAAAPPPAPAPVNLPITMPLTLSGWLIGGGALLGALGMLISLFDGALNPLELVILVALLAIAGTVFLADAMPAMANLRLATLAVVLVAFGVALDRLGFGGAGVGELLLFLGSAAAGIGAIILELGRDQPMGMAR
jgi:hypothetical protein